MPPHQRVGRRSVRTLVGLLVAALLVVVITITASRSAQAAGYPSWKDVQQAQASEQGKQQEITRITSLLDGLKSRAAAAAKTAAGAAARYEQAQGALTEATYRADQLDRQTQSAQRRATHSQRRAGNVAASLARSGADTLTTRLLIDRGAGSLLDRLEMMSQLAKASAAIYSTARRDRNDAAAVSAQAHAVKRSLDALATAAQLAFTAAKQTETDAQTALSAQQLNAATLQAQLVVLQQNRAATQADYQKGVAARQAAADAAAATAAAAAAAQRAAAAAAPASGGGQSGGVVNASGAGWTLPVSGWISSPFGPRPDRPAAGVGAFHYGVDIAAACGTTTRAASAGTVTYAGWLGTYGNWVLIDNGGGVQTGYAHSAVLLVTNGEHVSAGQAIAQVGTTGASSGCHLHFEVRVGGASIDPVPFMQARGVTVG